MVVQHNLTAINANRYFGINNTKLSKSLEKLSSGYAINRAGDNAAGLAVSEKMRAQIAGINQGVKNAQDGISMVQTFEGALTETDSILQRMRTLATQSANGTYQNDVDREAIQLEYNQLNDELNQIADTDFNGVVVLNGGQMADGLKAVDGEFDYKQKAAQVTEEQNQALAKAQENAQSAIDKAQKAFDAAKKEYDGVANRDLSNKGNAAQWNTVDNSKYTSSKANAMFDAITVGGKKLSELNVSSIDVTFQAKNDGTWEIKEGSYVDETGTKQTLAKGDLEKANAIGKIVSSGNGGFAISTDTTETATKTEDISADKLLANAVLDAAEVKAGDTVTLTFTNSSANTYAPTNIALDKDSYNNGTNDKKLSSPTVKISASLTSDSMTQETADALKKLDAATVSYEYDGKKIKNMKISDESFTIEEDKKNAGTYNISYKNSEGKDIVLATVTPTAGQNKAAAGNATNVKIAATATTAANVTADTQDFYYQADGTWNTKEDGTGTEIAATKVGGADIVAPTKDAGTDFAVGDKITVTTTAKKQDIGVTYAPAAAKEATSGTISFGIAVDAFNYDSETAKPTVKPGADAGIDSSKTTAIDKAYYEAKEALNTAKAAYPKTYEDLGIEEGVSKSDSNNASTATLTYKDNVTLQVGARTKDSVNFTFKYDSNGLGELKADMDCSARGLGTDKLSLATQEDANVAIDKIDNALNKVSMVRGTFGAVQNRLEHKIDNLNTTSENLTSAESRIRDTNMAEEMMNFTKNQILSQASQSMLAQANQLPQGVLSLLQ